MVAVDGRALDPKLLCVLSVFHFLTVWFIKNCTFLLDQIRASG